MRALGGGDLGFVPTMGAFHEGHLSLMRRARQNHQQVCVSLFVNPLQFGRGEDLGKYPRDESRDFHLAEGEGVDFMFAPTSSEIYPRESTTVHVPEITQSWEGKSRPGHFDGVATVVAKLFNIVRPRVAYFGWKDLQQCLVVRRMVEDLDIPLHLDFVDTIREPDGLAMSSRNQYLTEAERNRAPMLHRCLTALSDSISKGSSDIDQLLSDAKAELAGAGFDVDYLEMVSLVNLTPTRVAKDAAIIAAAKLGTTRLIDNLRINPSQG